MALLTKYIKYFKASDSEDSEKGSIEFIKASRYSFIFFEPIQEVCDSKTGFI